MSFDIITLYAIAFEYINNDKATMDFLAGKYAVSKTTINRYLNGKAGVWLDPETQKQVLETKKARWLAAKKTCGNLGHKKISTDKARELAGKLVEEGLTLKQVKDETGIEVSASTIYGALNEKNLGSELHGDVCKQYGQNKKAAVEGIRRGATDATKESIVDAASILVDDGNDRKDDDTERLVVDEGARKHK